MLEHVLLKAKVQGINLIDLCGSYGYSIQAATSKAYISLDIEGSPSKFVPFYESFISFMSVLEDSLEINTDFLEQEKHVILREIEYKADQPTHREREDFFFTEWSRTALEHSVLGSEASLSAIGAQDVMFHLRKFTRAYPRITLVHYGAGDRAQLEKLTAAFVDGKVLVTSDEYVKVLYALIVHTAQKQHVEQAEIRYYGSMCRLSLSFAARQQLLRLSGRQIGEAIKDYPGNPNLKSEMLDTLITGNSKLLVREMFSLLEDIRITIHSAGPAAAINQIIDMRIINNHRWCRVVSGGEHYAFAALSFYPDASIRSRIKSVAAGLLRYLNSVCTAELSITCEIGLISIYVCGLPDKVMEAVKTVIHLNPPEVQRFLHSGAGQWCEGHSVEKICDYYLHNCSLEGQVERVWMSSMDLSKRLSEQIRKGTAVVTSMECSSDVIEMLEDCPLHQCSGGLIPVSPKESDAAALMSFPDEYIEIWPGPDFFSPDKSLSHALWSIIAGIDGEMFRSLTLGDAKVYSHTFFPRELYDFGYRLLYIHCPDPVLKSELGLRFREILRAIQRDLDSRSVEAAKEKVRLKQQRSNTQSAQKYLYLSAYLLGHADARDFFKYETGLDLIRPDTMHAYITQMLDSQTILWGTEGTGNVELYIN